MHGGCLHLHDSTFTSLDWLIGTVSYFPNLYTRVESGRYPTRKYKFSDTHPGADWVSLEKLRSEASDVKEFDNKLKLDMSIWVEDPFHAYLSINDIWKKFDGYFASLAGLTASTENYRMYLEQGLREFLDDGVQYVELKTGTKSDANGNDASDAYLDMVLDVVNNFKIKNPDFIGLKIILGSLRSLASQSSKVNRTIELMRKYPDLVKGFDLYQQEDKNHMTIDYADDLLANEKSRLPYFFHSGETAWTQWVDYNLVDSILMNATRIGHGFAAFHHPKVMEAVLSKGIVIEVNPISNQVLGFVHDLRNHPGAYLIANGAPIVISSDDPAAWLAAPLSHDFYMTFMALGSITDDLRLLKQLAINSITYSTMTAAEKGDAMTKWQKSWDKFIEKIILKYAL